MSEAETLERYAPLCERLQLTAPLPIDPDWSAAPDFLQLIADRALAARPNATIECSSGATTVVLARCCQLNGRGHIYSLENGAEYAEATREALRRHRLADYATVIHAPLEAVTLEGEEYQWYRRAELLSLLGGRRAELVVVDGPPGFIQPQSRYPALPLLEGVLAPGFTLLLDDAARDDEQAIVRRWREGRPQLELEYLESERGTAILSDTLAG